MQRFLSLRSLLITLMLPLTVAACNKAAGSGGVPPEKAEFIGTWTGSNSTMTITATGHITSHIVDAKGAAADVDGEVVAFNPTSLEVKAAGATMTIPLKKAPQQVGSQWTMVVAGIESGEVTLVKK